MNSSKSYCVKTKFVSLEVETTTKENAIAIFKEIYKHCINSGDEITVSEPETLAYVTKEQYDYCINNILCIFSDDLSLASHWIMTGYKHKFQVNTKYIDLIEENIIANKN
jgi:hypothetical protein